MQLALSRNQWYADVDAFADTHQIPTQLRMQLRGVVNAALNKVVAPSANDHMVALLKKHVDPVVLIDGEPYDVKIFVPHNQTTHRQFAELVRVGEDADTVGAGRSVPLQDMP